jgi:hypothetical protein
MITNLKCQIQRNTIHQEPNNEGNKNSMKWTTFTYYSPKIRKITNLFKYTDIKTAFKYKNAVPQLTTPKKANIIQIYSKSGIYKLTLILLTWRIG